MSNGKKQLKTNTTESSPIFEFIPLTKDSWKEFETLFGERGACGGCWCMWWRLKHSVFERCKGEANKRAMRKLVGSGAVPGILALHDGIPVGWCSVAPREDFQRLDRSRVLKRVDDAPVWSVVCFFVAKPYRKKSVSQALLKAAVQYAGECGAGIVEGYPVEPRKDVTPDAFAYTGLASVFRKAGFIEVERRSPTRPIMRYFVKK